MQKNHSEKELKPYEIPKREAIVLAQKEIMEIKGAKDLVEISMREEVSKIQIDFKLMVNVIMGKTNYNLKQDIVEDVEFLPGLSRIKSILEKYDLSFLMLEKGWITFRRTQNYRPRKH